jgi:hypothetical protein
MKLARVTWGLGIMVLLLGLPAAGQGNGPSDDGDDHCTSIAVGRLASADGSVIGSHDDTCRNSRLHVVPVRDWPPGSTAPVNYGLMDVPQGTPYEYRGKIIGEVPQVPHTFACLHTGYPQMNERQLMIAESTLDQREDLEKIANTGHQIIILANTRVSRDVDLSQPDSFMGSANYNQAAIAQSHPRTAVRAYCTYEVLAHQQEPLVVLLSAHGQPYIKLFFRRRSSVVEDTVLVWRGRLTALPLERIHQ